MLEDRGNIENNLRNTETTIHSIWKIIFWDQPSKYANFGLELVVLVPKSMSLCYREGKGNTREQYTLRNGYFNKNKKKQCLEVSSYLLLPYSSTFRSNPLPRISD